jgi:starch synthase
MRVLLAAAELAPVTSVGGLGEVVAGLVAELRATGVDVDVVIPDYAPRQVALDGEVR